MTDNDRQTVTMILQADDGSEVAEQLLPLVYEELRRIAARQMSKETPGHTLQPTALVHEAYLQLVGDADIRWKNRGHFYTTAARAMRRILVNRARSKKSEKHGGKRHRQEFDDAFSVAEEPQAEHLLALDEALKKLEQIDARKGKIVMLRFFAGMSIENTAKSLDVSPATVKRDWQFSRAWLKREVSK